jgi:ribosome modulation factor
MTYRSIGNREHLDTCYRKGIADYFNPSKSILSCVYQKPSERKAWFDGYKYAEQHERNNPSDPDFLRLFKAVQQSNSQD